MARHKTAVKAESDRLTEKLKQADLKRQAAELEIESLTTTAKARELELAEVRKEALLKKKLVRWRRKGWLYFLSLLSLGLILWLVFLRPSVSGWLNAKSTPAELISLALPWLQAGYLAVLATFLGVLVMRYHNESVIKAFEERIQKTPGFRKELEQ